MANDGSRENLSGELAELADLYSKGKLSELEFVAAKQAVLERHGSFSRGATRNDVKPPHGRLTLLGFIVFAALLVAAWLLFQAGIGTQQARRIVATATRTPIEVGSGVYDLPVSSWRSVPFNLPYAGSTTIDLEVVRGNPVEVFVTDAEGMEALESGSSRVQQYSSFYATKSREYERTAPLSQGTHFLVLRDNSLGLLSAHSTDIKLAIRLQP